MRQVTLLALAALLLATGPAFADPCSPGSSSPDGNTPCDPCAAGYFASTYGSQECSACPVGRYAPDQGSVQCLLCPAGTFTSTVGSAACQVCPDGSIAPLNGSSSCQPCDPGYTSNDSHTECVPVAVPARPYSWGLLKARYR